MKLTIAIMLLSMISGCAVGLRQSSPAEVLSIPTDCVNKYYIEQYLMQQSNMKKPFYISDADWGANHSAIRTKIWELRARCQ